MLENLKWRNIVNHVSADYIWMRHSLLFQLKTVPLVQVVELLPKQDSKNCSTSYHFIIKCKRSVTKFIVEEQGEHCSLQNLYHFYSFYINRYIFNSIKRLKFIDLYKRINIDSVTKDTEFLLLLHYWLCLSRICIIFK